MKREEVLAVLDYLLRLKGPRALTNSTWQELNSARDFIASALDDAERYRWLRNSGSNLNPLFSEGSCGPVEMFDGDELDTAIDTARAAAAGGEGVL